MSRTLPFLLVALLAAPAFSADPSDDVDRLFREKVKEARRYDLNWFKAPDVPDREKCVALYREAIALRPDDVRNIEIDERIAQLYQWYEDERFDLYPDLPVASRQYEHIVDAYPPTRLRWYQAHIGAASCGMMSKDAPSALEHYRTVLYADPSIIEYPQPTSWRNVTPANDQQRRRMEEYLGTEQKRFYDGIHKMRLKMVGKMAHASVRISASLFLHEMREIKRNFPDSDFSGKADEFLAAWNEEHGRESRQLAVPALDVDALIEGAPPDIPPAPPVQTAPAAVEAVTAAETGAATLPATPAESGGRMVVILVSLSSLALIAVLFPLFRRRYLKQ